MNLFVPTSVRRRAAFTLPELMVALSVFSFVVVGVIFAHLYGLSMYRITGNALTATESARQVTARMTDEIRTCRSAVIGGVSNGVFVARLNGEKQRGNGLLIYPAASTNNYVIYFVNPADQTFRRTTSKPNSAAIVAESVTNEFVFRAENFLGQLQTNSLNNRVIHFSLEFFQPRRHRQIADYFKLESSVTRRVQ
jgi:prepilin-type N-terminal cleavage/methylation domain-containing protein